MNETGSVHSEQTHLCVLDYLKLRVTAVACSTHGVNNLFISAFAFALFLQVLDKDRSHHSVYNNVYIPVVIYKNSFVFN